LHFQKEGIFAASWSVQPWKIYQGKYMPYRASVGPWLIGEVFFVFSVVLIASSDWRERLAGVIIVE
jgi:hypothetical protein